MYQEDSFTPFSFLSKLSPSELEQLQAIAHLNLFQKNTYIFRANELNDALYVLLEGRVKITRISQHGRELIQWFCLPGEIFGLAEDNFSQHRGLYAQSITDSKILCIQKTDYESFLLEHPRISLLIIKQLASRLRSLGDTLLNITSDDANARFIKLLQRLADFYGREHDMGIYVDIYLTHQQMADMIGVCRQTVSSLIGQMKRGGVIQTNRNGIYISSPHKLHQYGLQPESILQSL